MFEGKRFWIILVSYALAIVFGLSAAAVDVAAPFGDDTAKATLFVWLVSSGLMGFVQPDRPWRWALLIGPWAPAVHLILQTLRMAGPLESETKTVLLLIFVSLGACLAAAYSGSLIRRLTA